MTMDGDDGDDDDDDDDVSYSISGVYFSGQSIN